MNRKPFILLAALLIVACGQGKKKPETDWNAIRWPVFRGDPSLSGYTDQPPPKDPVLRWSFDTGSPVISSPVMAGGSVYAGSTSGIIYSISLKSGDEQWTFDAGDDIEAPPLYLDGRIFIGTLNGVFLALDAQNGAEIWRYDIGSDIMGSANAAGNDAKVVFVGSYDGILYGFHAEKGGLLWQYETDNYINGTPATDGKRIMFGGCDELLHIVNAENGSKIAEVNAGSYIPGSPAVSDGMAYVGHYGSRLLAVDIARRKIVWEYESREGGRPFFASPAIGKDVIVAGSRDKMLHCVSRESGEALWTFRTRDEIDSSPVIAGGVVITASMDGRLYMVELKTGKSLWSYEIGAAITSSPAVAGGQIVIGADDGRIYAFGDK